MSVYTFHHAFALIPGLPPQGLDLDRFEPLFSNTLSTSLFEAPQSLLLSMMIGNSPGPLRYIHSIRKIILTLAPPPFCFILSLYHSIGGRAPGITPFKLIPRHQTVSLITSRVCILVGRTAIVIFDYRASFLFYEIAVEIEIAKKRVEVARNINVDSIVLCNH
jgi:hypothetical protein